LFRSLGDRLSRTWAIDELGLVQQATGDYQAAAASVAAAAELFRDLGNRPGMAKAHNSLGELATRTSAPGQARSEHGQALAIARELGVAHEEARALEGIGRSFLPGEPAEAAAHLRDALAIYQRLGVPEAQSIRDTLGELGL
jgi:tetratricopeptide (TPR) repeat protein